MKNTKNVKQALNHSARLKKAGLGIIYIITAFTVMLYGLILSTNLLTQLNPANTLIYYSTAMGCYGLLFGCTYLLWVKMNKTINQAYSGIEN